MFLQVCARLGLTSLAYMWHQPQAGLLADMVQGQVQAVLCKVAAMGLRPDKHLGKSLAEMQPVLHHLRRCVLCQTRCRRSFQNKVQGTVAKVLR